VDPAVLDLTEVHLKVILDKEDLLPDILRVEILTR
jgi:hypothetical protein